MLLKPSKTCDEAIKFLETLTEQGLNNVQVSIPHISSGNNWSRSEDRDAMVPVVREYDQWTLKAAQELLEVFADRSVAARLRGERYTSIMYGHYEPARLAYLLNGEFFELRAFFAQLANELRETKERFKDHQAKTVVLDTNDLLHHMRYDKIPWQRIFGKGTTVVIPHVVVDEIDKKSYAISDTVQRRARGVFALLEKTLTAIEVTGRHEVAGTSIEVLLDEPGHVRLPNNDDEIVSRALYLQQAIFPTPVTVVTGDNGMRARALAWGLKARKLDERYRIKKLSAEQKAENLASIDFEVPAEDDAIEGDEAP
ncbi:PIN domain-containing protein [Streptomyces sp. NPDC050147]|uniref:PIN domain-containing protein n=1 Tax=Streptomyces sp. NPDC050147 TaxID=3155513 RepID=UPI00341A3ECA